MAEDNSGKIKHDGIVPEQSVSGTPPALTATRDSMAWLFKNKFLRLIFSIVLAALICTAIYSIYIFTRHADPAEIFIFSAARYRPDKPFTVLVLARDAKAELPLQNQSIDLYMGLDGKELRKLPPVKTGADGIAPVLVSPCPAGKYQLKAVLRDLSAVSNFEVKSVYKSMLTSDKPMYQPGQTIHLRNLALNAIDLHPAPENDVNFKINDPNGNLVFDQTVKSSAYGIAAADFQLAEQAKAGEYKIQVSSEQTAAAHSVIVKPYSKTECKITLDTDKTFYLPGDKVSGTVSISDLYGKPFASTKVLLNASVTVKVSETRKHGRWNSSTEIVSREQQLTAVNGITDAAGNIKFEFMIPKGLAGINFQQEDTDCKISVTTAPATSHQQIFSRTLIVTGVPVRITFMPEFNHILPGITSNIYISVSNPCGAPLEATLQIGGQTLFTGQDGLALISRPSEDHTELIATDSNGYKGSENISCDYNTSKDAFILKNKKVLVRAGEELQLEIVANQPGGRIFIYLVKDGIELEFISVSMNTGQTPLKLKIPGYLSGTIQIHAYRFQNDGKPMHELRLVQIISEKQLPVKISSSQPENKHDKTIKTGFQTCESSQEQAYFLVQKELLWVECQPMADAVLLNEPVNPLTAGYLLAKHQNLSNLQTQSCPKYVDRESALIQPRMKLGNNFFSYLLEVILALLFIINIPFLLVALNTKNNSYWMAVSKEYPGKITRLLRKLQWMFSAITGCAMFFIFFVCPDQPDGLKFEHVLALSILFIMLLLLAKSVKIRNRIFLYCRPDSGSHLQKIIFLIPWFYGVFVFAFSILIVTEIFFPNTPGLCLVECIFFALTLIPLFGLSGIQCSVCTQDYLDLYCNRDISNMGLGIGCYLRSFSLWIMGSGLYIGPIIITYLIIATVIISLFLPLCMIIDKLGK